MIYTPQHIIVFCLFLFALFHLSVMIYMFYISKNTNDKLKIKMKIEE